MAQLTAESVVSASATGVRSPPTVAAIAASPANAIAAPAI